MPYFVPNEGRKWISFKDTEDLLLNPLPKWLKDIVEEANLDYHIRQSHPEWVEHWNWLKEFSTTSQYPEEDYTIDNNL
jgi:hypothetical protein